MFGFNFFEILVILVVAIIFLGPDKLPQLIVDVVKFFKMIKKQVNEAKDTFEKELQINELKNEALEYKAQFESKTNEYAKEFSLQDINQDIDEMFNDYKKIEAQPAVENLDTQEISPKKGKATGFKKKQIQSQQEASSVNSPPKRRGRPPKQVKTEKQEKTEPKRRGRPPKQTKTDLKSDSQKAPKKAK